MESEWGSKFQSHEHVKYDNLFGNVSYFVVVTKPMKLQSHGGFMPPVICASFGVRELC